MAIRTGPTLAEVEAARGRIGSLARVTPVYSSETLSRRSGRPVLLKAENLQRTGSFKIRGAVNKIATLTDAQRRAGVVTASAGNHGQAVALAAREAGVKATVFMPQDAPMAKVDATRSDRVEAGAVLVHAFEDEVVVAGQGTLGLELAEQMGDVEVLVVPIGGGGLASGIAIALKDLRPGVKIVGVQAAACAPFAGIEPVGTTIADGIAVKKPGELTAQILEDRLDDVVVVNDREIAQAIVVLLERVKLVVEGAGAASVAAVLGGKVGGSGPACAL